MSRTGPSASRYCFRGTSTKRTFALSDFFEEESLKIKTKGKRKPRARGGAVTVAVAVAGAGAFKKMKFSAALPHSAPSSPLTLRRTPNASLVKGYWTKEEDEKLAELVQELGTKRWAAIARSIPGRIGKQCRERWHNHLDPDIKKGSWTQQEDTILASAHLQLGNKWAAIARLLPGRSENAVKNHWNSSLRKKPNIKMMAQKQSKKGKAGEASAAEPSNLAVIEADDDHDQDNGEEHLSWADSGYHLPNDFSSIFPETYDHPLALGHA